ncbi:trehalose-phosphatase [Glaciimonas sp. PCH181]|uniref:trehalose-phosphatase n=1 Tax=Glaciimonas sp. PCH181 TaxID=2133943 RepID=UPI000D3A64A0|nr:trehalose-phosphatase [Glaciimonas sp. PCH181]PUA18804.1 trehalose-phosphatase [Glaciimonas sp. PCH181]
MQNAQPTDAHFNVHALLECALFLDFDGTLVDLAPTPEEVVISPELIASLHAVRDLLDGRLAIVSGRPIAQIDAMLATITLPVAGVHGMERRDIDGVLHYAPVTEFSAMQTCVNELAAAHPGLRVEQKRGALALHYRQAPELEVVCKFAMQAALRNCPGVVLIHGKMVIEAKADSVNKGTAIRDFLAEPPFNSTRPVFFGDDTTDEIGFAYVQEVGGMAIKIGAGASVAGYRIASPQALRTELSQLARLAQEPHLLSIAKER